MIYMSIMYILCVYLCESMHMRACRHAYMRKITYLDKVQVGEFRHRSDKDTHLTCLPLSQLGQTPLEVADNEEVKAAFAQHAARGGQEEQTSE